MGYKKPSSKGSVWEELEWPSLASNGLSAHCFTLILSGEGPQPIRWSKASEFHSLGLVPGSICYHKSLLRTSDNDLQQVPKALWNTGTFVTFVRRQMLVLWGRPTGWWDTRASEQPEKSKNSDGEKSLRRSWKRGQRTRSLWVSGQGSPSNILANNQIWLVGSWGPRRQKGLSK